MFEKLSDNLNLLIAKARINANELARRTGLPASSIKKIRNCDNPNPTLTTLIPLAEFFSVTLSQLVGDETLPISKIRDQKEGKIMHQVPLITWKEAMTWPAKNNQLSFIATQHQYSDNAYALKVEEDDWNGFPRGAVLLIDPASVIEHRDFVIVYKEGQENPTLKQIFYDEGSQYLKPVMEGYSVTKFTPQHKYLGAVMESQRQIKQIKNNK